MRYRFGILYVLLLSLFTVHNAFASTLEETFKKRVDAGDIHTLEVANVNGKVEVTGWSGDEIEIVAYKRVRASGLERAQRMMDALKVDVAVEDHNLRVETRLPRKRRGHSGGFFSWLFGGGSSNSSVNYEIKVPKKLDLDIHSTNGSLLISDCDGEMLLSTTNGKVRAEDVAGAVKARSTNGSITITMRRVTEDAEMSFKTTNGSIKVYLPYKTDADLKALTTNGRIRCELPLREMYEKSKRRLEGEINDGGPLIYLKTTNGSISILEY